MSLENLETVRAVLEAVNRWDAEGSLRYFDPDVELIPRRSATEGSYRGHAGIVRFRADTLEMFDAFDVRYEVCELGDRVLWWGTVHVHGRGSDIETEIPLASVVEFRNGKISRWESFGSKAEALNAVGAEGVDDSNPG